MSEDKSKAIVTIKSNCNNCGGQRKAYVRGHHVAEGADDDAGVSYKNDYRILECCGCETFSFRIDYWFSEIDNIESKVWPSPVTRKAPDWIDEIQDRDDVLHRLMIEMYAATEGDQRVLAAIGARTVFDRASELLDIDADLSFGKKLDRLHETGRISKKDRSVLEVLVDAGSAAAHRGWRPTPGELNTMLVVVETFLQLSFVLEDGVKRLKKAVPRRRKRKPKPKAR